MLNGYGKFSGLSLSDLDPPSPPLNKSLSPYSSPLLGENSLGWGENRRQSPPFQKGFRGISTDVSEAHKV